MFNLLTRLFAGSDQELRIDGYWCGKSIKLPQKARTPLGSLISIVDVCVDIRYVLTSSDVVVKSVQLSKTGGSMLGSSMAINISATKTGEAWYEQTFPFASLLTDAVRAEIANPHSTLSKIIQGQRADAKELNVAKAFVAALTSSMPTEHLAAILEDGGHNIAITFAYTSSNGSTSTRSATIHKVVENSLRATDHKDGKLKSFRIDRIRNPRIAQ